MYEKYLSFYHFIVCILCANGEMSRLWREWEDFGLLSFIIIAIAGQKYKSSDRAIRMGQKMQFFTPFWHINFRGR